MWDCSVIAGSAGFTRLACAAVCLLVVGASRLPVEAIIYSAVPSRLNVSASSPATTLRADDSILIRNAFLTVHISPQTAVIIAIDNHLTQTRHQIVGDRVAVNDWVADGDTSHGFEVELQPDPAEVGHASVILKHSNVRITYSLAAGDFWIQRRISIIDSANGVDRLTYGRLHLENAERRVLALGKFDRPSILVASDRKGGLFAGVAHWFYSVTDDGTYANNDMNWRQGGGFESEPWHVGVFAVEPGEPYPGWFWYRAYLERTRDAAGMDDPRFTWNAGWGQWGVDIDDPVARDYLALMSRLGIDGVIFGSGGFGRGIAAYNALAAGDATTKSNLATLKRLGIAGGTLNNGAKPWHDVDTVPAMHQELKEHVAAGFGATAFDFFESRDTYAAHRRVADYFRLARETLDYTECHLGMAAYGPQFQRMVRVNHPDDIADFDISRFSADWTTFLAFRDSRRRWQQKYEYLMPEDGLYYYLTHYSNWGNPRRYTDPEPQQFLWSVPAYCGIGFNFHDAFGWRETIAAASAFTTAPVFGHIDLKMPRPDVEYARSFFDWMKENASALKSSRICAETEGHCIVSKVRDGRGLVYVLNYRPGAARFDLKFQTGHSGPLAVRQVYPTVDESRDVSDGDALSITARGESTTILEVNGALKSLPPRNGSRFPLELPLARKEAEWTATFGMPDVREAIENARDPTLPKRLLSLDQVQDSHPDLLVRIAADSDRRIPAVKWIGKGKLPDAFRRAYRFDDADTVETWKIVPWAYADRVWLVVRPNKPVPLTGPHPTALLNGQIVPLFPRVDHRFEQIGDWNCPLYHADLTQAVRFGQDNQLQISITGQEDLPIAYITTAAERGGADEP